MKKSIFEPAGLAEIHSRLEKLTAETQSRWGLLKVNQMLRHLVEANKIPGGQLNIADRSTFVGRTMMRYFLLRTMVPSLKMIKRSPPQTFDEINILKAGIPAGDFETEKENFKRSMAALQKQEKFPGRHPVIGKMNKKQWGWQTFSHYNYHFTQFGV